MLVYSTNHKFNKNLLDFGNTRYFTKTERFEYYESKYNSDFSQIKRFLRMVNKLGYSYKLIGKHSSYKSWSCYVEFEKEGFRSFLLRVSNHSLNNYNQLPAGCICEVTYLNSLISDFTRGVNKVRKMSQKEYDYLWTNRCISDYRC